MPYVVIGGELPNLSGSMNLNALIEETIERVGGVYEDHDAAYNAWKARTQATVDNALMRFFILATVPDDFVGVSCMVGPKGEISEIRQRYK